MIYSKDSEPFKIAADLIDKGANFQLIVDSIENELDLIDLQFISKALSSIKIYEDKKVVILPMKYEDWIFFCPEEDKSQMLTRYVRSIKDTNFGVVLIEKKPGIFRLSLRSHDPNFDVSQIALKLAGGGHKGAAGATIESESIDKAIEILLSNI
jgi:phosphoesterase RecJ-like protein